MIVLVFVCRRMGHRWGPWLPAEDVMGRPVADGTWLARECQRGCGHVEMPQPD
jgi:hypothetical protein